MEDTAETSYWIVKHQTAVALRLIAAKRPPKKMRNKRTMRPKLLLVTYDVPWKLVRFIRS